MKIRSLLFLILLFALTNVIQAAYFEFLPHNIKQPDGTSIDCFISGDEFFNFIHDKNGYTIIEAADGWYYYAEQDGDLLKPSKYRINSVNPADAGLIKWVRISRKEYMRRKGAMGNYKESKGGPENAPKTGTLNNLVVYIRFSDDNEFTTTRQSYDDKFNLSGSASLKTYFSEVSYNKLTISSTHYPASDMTTNLSYQDSHPRNYFEIYNATTNPSGYSNDSERTSREHKLLAAAITWLNSGSQFPTSLDLDGDNDGRVDNVCFIIKGGTGDWSELLWGHRWTLYSQTVYINGKRVYDYTFQPETQAGVRTLCHEMFHALGAPDLYHYTDQGVLSPVGSWDLMESGSGHMLAYMKWKYSKNNWISTIPVIETTGTYTLNPLTSPTNNCYKIPSPYSLDEFFVVEYRSKGGKFESNLPGSGLLVYRIDTRITGNADGPPDEVYLYRPGGTVTQNGSPSTAFFSSTAGRTAINDVTNPGSFLQDGSTGGLNISDVTSAGQTISFTFTVTIPELPGIPGSPSASDIQQSKFTAKWNSTPNVLGYRIDVSKDPDFTSFVPGYYNEDAGKVNSFVITGLSSKTQYFFRVKAYNSAGTGLPSESVQVKTLSDPSVAPSKLKSVSCNDQVSLKWNKSKGLDFKLYRIYTRTTGGNLIKTDSTAGGISDTSKIFNGLIRGSVHTFLVSAVNFDGVESSSSNASVVTVKTGVIPRIASKWGDVLICYNTGDSLKSFQWYRENELINGATSQYYQTNKIPGEYFVQATDKEGCKNISSSFPMTISDLSPGSGSVSVFPNPASSTISVKMVCSDEGVVRIRILNPLGTMVYESKTEKRGAEMVKEISVSGLARGLYHIQITIENQVRYSDQVIIYR